MNFHSLSDCSLYGEPGGAASARPHRVIAEICSLKIQQFQGIAISTTVNYTTFKKTLDSYDRSGTSPLRRGTH